MPTPLEEDFFRSLASRYQGAESDPELSYENPTAAPQAQFAQPTPDLSSRFYDPAGNFQFLAPNPQAPANQPQPEMLSGIQRIRNLAQLPDLMKQLQGVPDELKLRVLSQATGIPLTSPKALQLQNTLLQMRAKRELEAPDRAEKQRQAKESLDIRKQQLADMRAYRQGLVDQGTRFSAMMLRQHIMELRNQIKDQQLNPDPELIKEYQESVKEFGNLAKGFIASPQSATRGAVGGMGGVAAQARPTSGTINVGGKQVQWTRSPSEGE